jgi:hypothetical protein
MLTKTLLRIPFSVIGRMFSRADLSWLQGKCARITLSQAAFGMILYIPGGIFRVEIAALGPLKRVTGRIFKISK